MFSKFVGIGQLLRPKHWIKNVILLMPMVFSGTFLDLDTVTKSIIAFLYFCVASSLVYAINDLSDLDRDRLHPIKKIKRPIASGIVSVAEAKIVIAILSIITSSGYFFSLSFFAVLLFYILLNIAYSLYLKHQPVLDVFSVSLGFVLRVYAGAVAISVVLSSWMFITTFTLALYLASIKRLQELQLQGAGGRDVLKKYSPTIVRRYADISAISTILFYSLYCLTEHPRLISTIPLVLFGVFRYWYLVDEEDQGESPVDVLYSDIPLILVVVVWGTVVLYEFYPKH